MPATIPLLQEGRYSIEQEFPYLENCLLFQAYDTRDETPVTIVEVPVPLPKVATAAQREAAGVSFAEQARRVTSFRHRSVVAVRSHFIEAGRNYLVTDRVDGVDLASVLADRKECFTLEQITGWADTVLDALNALHNSRPAFIYRNLRPENIMLRADGNVDLVASGMVCCGPNGASNTGASPLAYSPLEQIWSGLDAASQKVIINKYDESSEKILKQELDARSDLYSLGATLYQLVTRQIPVDALERSIEMIEGNADPLVAPNKVEVSVPVEVSDVIMKAMEIRREYRFDSAAIMRQVMKTALVRVREREAEEALVQKVEQHDVTPVVRNAQEVPGPRLDVHAAVEQKRREAEQELFDAERRMTDADQHETEPPRTARVTETFNLEDLEDDVLGILSPSAHTSEPPQAMSLRAVAPPVVEHRTAEITPPVSEPEQDELETEPIARQQVLEEPLAQADGSGPVESAETNPESGSLETEPEQVVEVPELPKPEKAAAAAAGFSSVSSGNLFSEPKGGKGVGMPAIAAAAVVLCVVAIGGWFYMGSSTTPAETAETPAATQPIEPVQQDVPAKTAFQPSDEPAAEPTSASVTDQPALDQPITDQPAGQEQQPQKVASTAPTKAKRPLQAPTKAPAQKKVVTVDDLINDN